MKKIPASVFQRLSYNPDTGILVWIEKNKSHPTLLGKEAGTVRKNKNGYLRKVIKIDGIAYFAHRIAWFLFYKEQPNIVDHVNGNTLDNRISNLRNVTESENAKNHGKEVNKSGLPCGVRLLPSGNFQSRIRCDNKEIVIGCFENVNDAKAAYLTKRDELFKEYSRKA